jgi:hypothetical protein
VVVFIQEVEVGVEVEGGRRIGESEVLQIRPGVGRRQVDGLTRPIGEVTRVFRVDPERP